MSDNNTLELVFEVDANRANASIKSLNASLSSMEASAVKTARGAAQGIDGMKAAISLRALRTAQLSSPSCAVKPPARP